MVNTLRHYHLGCGERLQTFYTLTLKSKVMKPESAMQLKSKTRLQKGKQ